jgi:diguanylate cyclase (GGDEF)-like protein
MASRRSQARLQAALMLATLLLLCALGAGAALRSHRQLHAQQERLVELHRLSAEAQQLVLLAVESQALTRQWLISFRQEDRDAALRGADALRQQGGELAGRLEPALLDRGLPALGPALAHVMRLRDQMQALAEQAGPEAARQAAARGDGAATTRQMRDVLAELLALTAAETQRADAELRGAQLNGLLLVGGSSLAMLAMLLGTLLLLARRHRAAEQAGAATDRRGRQVATLFRMGELLQSSLSPEDVKRVVAHTARELLPEMDGAFYVFNNSRDRLDLMAAWGRPGAPAPRLPEHFAPNDCWALKRGRPHGCGTGGGLHCDHAGEDGHCALCVPMQARGEVYGVLQFIPPTGQAAPSLARDDLAQALADGVSLALANLSLREKLRNQALKDELTGLYNRRFIEETAPRLLAHAERRGAGVSVLMLDLDHFKQVNDRHGHAVGDELLREVGAMLRTRLRQMDIACRYGGEELLVLLPDCAPVDALNRAEDLCTLVRRLHDLRDGRLPPVSVSIGVAAWPDHGTRLNEVIEAADAALYAAKRAGRDRAVMAAPRPAALAGAALPAPVA